MQVEAIPMLINGDFLNAPLDVKMHLADYKMYGEDSYVFQQKELLHGLYECTYLSMNDRRINGEAFEYLLKNNKHIGEVLTAVFDLGSKEIIKTLENMTLVVNSQIAITAVLNSQTAMTAVLNSQTAMTAVANSQTAMTAVANSQTAITAVLNSQTAMTAVLNSQTAMTAVANSQTAMTAVANSQTAMTEVLNSQTAITAVQNTSIGKDVKLKGDLSWYNEKELIFKGIIVSFYSPNVDPAITVKRIDGKIVATTQEDRNAAIRNKVGWTPWFGRFSKDPALNIVRNKLIYNDYYPDSAVRYIPID